jgi:hypothetical protein
MGDIGKYHTKLIHLGQGWFNQLDQSRGWPHSSVFGYTTGVSFSEQSTCSACSPSRRLPKVGAQSLQQQSLV